MVLWEGLILLQYFLPIPLKKKINKSIKLYKKKGFSFVEDIVEEIIKCLLKPAYQYT